MDLITLALAKKQIGQGIPAAVSDYLGEHLTNPTNPPIDTSLAIAGAAADSKATGDKLSELKEDLSEIDADFYETKTVTETESMTNLSWNYGYYTNGVGYGIGDSTSSYKNTEITDLMEGDVYKAFRGQQQTIRFVDSYNGDTLVAHESNQQEILIGANVTKIVLSIPKSLVDASDFAIKRTRIEAQKDIKIYTEMWKKMQYGIKSVRGTAFPLSIDCYQSLKKGARISASLTFSTFISAEIGMQTSGGVRDYSVTVDGTNVTYAYGASGSVTAAHGLTIENNLQIVIDESKDGKINIFITSNGETFAKSWVFVNNKLSAPFLNCGGAAEGTLTFAVDDIDKDIWAFGDSYFSYDAKRWMYYYFNSDADNALVNAFPGESSTDIIPAIKSLLQIGKPKFILYCVGMNDGSDGENAPSSTWSTAIASLLEICANNGITPIMATIPTVATVNNEQKNAFVRSSNYQYIDFAKAVGAQSNGTWYADMLSSDGVHPTEKGAKTLYAQAIIDCPQLYANK